MKANLFNYHLPKERIAQSALQPKDSSKLMIINKSNHTIKHKIFRDIISEVETGSLFIMNNTKVIPARIYCKRATGGLIEILFLEPDSDEYRWKCFARPSKRLYPNENIEILDKTGKLTNNWLSIIEKKGNGVMIVNSLVSLTTIQNKYGTLALPPYITKKLINDSEYQTCYAKHSGSIAAPTAGLHFTSELIDELKNKQISFEFVNLKIGPGTFKPVIEADIEKHEMHEEHFEITPKAAKNINTFKRQGKRIYVVGTTTCRALESSTDDDGYIKSFKGKTNIFIYPGYKFKFVENLITNFHLPKSTLLMLVSALYERNKMLEAYNVAVRENYRFYSLGDAMLIRD